MKDFLISSFLIFSCTINMFGQNEAVDYCTFQKQNPINFSTFDKTLGSLLHDSNDTLNYCLLTNFLERKPKETISQNIIDSIIHFANKRYEEASFESAIMYADFGISLAKINRDTARILSLSTYKLNSFNRLGEFYKCHSTILECKELARKSNNHEKFGSLLLNEGYSYWKIYHRPKGLEIADDYYAYYKKHNLPKTELYSYHGLKATIYRALEQYELSRIHGDSAIHYAFLLDNDKAKGLALSNRAIQYPDNSIEEMDYRKNLLQQALVINKQMNDKQQLASNYGALATLYRKNREFDNSIKFSNMSVGIANQINDKTEIYYHHLRLTSVYNSQKKYKEALYHKRKEIEYYKELFGFEDMFRLYGKSLESKSQKELEKLNEIEYRKEQNEIKASKAQNQILLILIGSLIVLGILSYLIIRNWMKSKIENAIIKEDISNQINALETQTLRSQMNPHFLFNCLNSIKSYIAKREPRQATKYLNKFSQLIRQILNISKEEWISLEDELKALKLYIELEQLRMSNAFEFEIEIADNINSKEIKVPPLIFQPFVENSIWHGLSHKKGPKSMSIVLNKVQNKIRATIEDNGIGRKASALIKKQSNSQHVSHGMRITKDRLRLSDKNFRDNFNISTIDLYDLNSNAIGTKISIEIPSILN